MSAHKPKRRFFRYSLRTMLVVVLVLSVWLGWMANRAAKQRRAVALVKELGGSVTYDCQARFTTTGGSRRNLVVNTGEMTIYEPPPEDDLLHKYIGHDWFHDVGHVVLVGTDVTDEQLEQVVDGLPNIVQLTLINCCITDAGLEHLALLKKLETVFLHGTSVTDDGIARLERQSLKPMIVRIP